MFNQSERPGARARLGGIVILHTAAEPSADAIKVENAEMEITPASAGVIRPGLMDFVCFLVAPLWAAWRQTDRVLLCPIIDSGVGTLMKSK